MELGEATVVLVVMLCLVRLGELSPRACSPWPAGDFFFLCLLVLLWPPTAPCPRAPGASYKEEARVTKGGGALLQMSADRMLSGWCELMAR